MYKIIENTNTISAKDSCFNNVKIYFNLDGCSYNFEKKENKRFFMLCSGSATFLLEKDDLQNDSVSLSENTVISIDSNVNVILTEYTKTTKIVCIEEKNNA